MLRRGSQEEAGAHIRRHHTGYSRRRGRAWVPATLLGRSPHAYALRWLTSPTAGCFWLQVGGAAGEDKPAPQPRGAAARSVSGMQVTGDGGVERRIGGRRARAAAAQAQAAPTVLTPSAGVAGDDDEAGGASAEPGGASKAAGGAADAQRGMGGARRGSAVSFEQMDVDEGEAEAAAEEERPQSAAAEATSSGPDRPPSSAFNFEEDF